MKTIVMRTKGYIAIVDDDDYELLSQTKWFASCGGNPNLPYAIGDIRSADGKARRTRMHRFILGVNDPTMDVDHINHNTLDNRKSNLRVATRSENIAHKRTRGGVNTKFRGVTCQPRARGGGRCWLAMITKDQQVHCIGGFYTELAAAAAYNASAHRLFGEFAMLNNLSPAI